jgi:hypothetical protein
MAASAAGRRRRARCSKNLGSDTRPVRACSPRTTVAMRKPDRVKNVDTVNMAPDTNVTPWW